jgi:large subunit ribosomal protein L5
MSFKKDYQQKVVPKLKAALNLTNTMAVPKIEKVVINVGVGKTLKDAKMLEAIIEDLKRISGQTPVKTIAKKSIAGFKIREGQVVGLMTTLRGQRMYDFVEKLIKIALPRVRDFKGLNPKSFDHRGNYNIGIKEQIVFPETSREHIEHTFGMEVNIQTSTTRFPVRD